MDRLLGKIGLNKVFEPLKKDKHFQEFLKKRPEFAKVAEEFIDAGRDLSLGFAAEWLLDEFREWLSINGYLDPLFDDIHELYNDARDWTIPGRDPLAIDLDGDGIETIGADGTVVFDHDGDGVKTGTGWVKADDAFVVLDRNGNGLIDTGAELFGVDTVKADGSFAVDGFDALSDLDSNGDGVFDAKDSEFANVRLWQDMDQDGVSDEGELTSLTDAGIVSINLEAKSGNVNLGNGNVQTGTAAHLTVDGERAPPAISTWCSIRFTANLPIR